MDLDTLFTFTNYKKTTIEIPCKRETSSEEDLQVELFVSPQATTDYDLTGQILWPVSVLLSHYLASPRGRALIQNKRVVEIGAGTGLPSLVAAHFASQVLVTDGNGDVIVDLLKKNVDALKQSKRENVGEINVMQLLWGDCSNLKAALCHMESNVDVVIAADVVQWPAVVEPLLHTVKALLWNSNCEHPTFVLGIVNRASKTYNMFFEVASRLGFASNRIDLQSMFADGVVPNSCQEFGGRVTEIYEVVLVDRNIIPVLLKDSQEDMTVGKSFHALSSLPC